MNKIIKEQVTRFGSMWFQWMITTITIGSYRKSFIVRWHECPSQDIGDKAEQSALENQCFDNFLCYLFLLAQK